MSCVLAGVLSLGVGLLACSGEEADREPQESTPLDWVRIHDPDRAWTGYTLTLFHHRVPTLIDMNGRIVHSWPEARVKSRVRLLENGNLLGIALGRSVVEYDWEGREVWRHDFEREVPHHDVLRLANGNTLVVVLPDDQPMDVLRELDGRGNTIWEWRSGEHLQEFVDSAFTVTEGDITHINSFQELPPNPLFEGGDSRFAPGNLLVSARNLDLIFVIDRVSSKVVWSYRGELDLQHEALMKGADLPRPGNILVFDNGKRSRRTWRRSRVIEIDPQSAEIVWSYSSDDFFSQTGGVQQPLPNGNVMIASSVGGRIFEVDHGGEIVWQWTPPFEPTRPARLARDHCPQLAALELLPPTRVQMPAGERYVDRDLYRFVYRGGIRRRPVAGQQRRLLRRNDRCVEMMLPIAATARLEFGIDGQAAERAQAPQQARFVLSATEGSAANVLFDRSVSTTSSSWNVAEVDLDEFATRRIDVCVEVRDGDRRLTDTESWAMWASPFVSGEIEEEGSEGDGDADSAEDGDGDAVDDEELEVRRRLLETHGYVN